MTDKFRDVSCPSPAVNGAKVDPHPESVRKQGRSAPRLATRPWSTPNAVHQDSPALAKLGSCNMVTYYRQKKKRKLSLSFDPSLPWGSKTCTNCLLLTLVYRRTPDQKEIFTEQFNLAFGARTWWHTIQKRDNYDFLFLALVCRHSFMSIVPTLWQHNNMRISRAPSHVKHAQLRWTSANINSQLSS